MGIVRQVLEPRVRLKGCGIAGLYRRDKTGVAHDGHDIRVLDQFLNVSHDIRVGHDLGLYGLEFRCCGYIRCDGRCCFRGHRGNVAVGDVELTHGCGLDHVRTVFHADNAAFDLGPVV